MHFNLFATLYNSPPTNLKSLQFRVTCTILWFRWIKKPLSSKERLKLNSYCYPAQHDNLDTSLSNVRAANFNPSAIVK